MLSTLAVAWRTTVKRLAADWLIATAAFATIVLATVLLSSGPIYADAVTISALGETIGNAPVTESNVSIEASLFPDLHHRADRAVRATVADELATTGGDVYAFIESETYGLDSSTADDLTEVASFWYLESVEERATLTAGEWPQSGTPWIEVALPELTATSLGVDVGETIDVTNRRERSFTRSVRVVGVFGVDDPNDPYWFAAPPNQQFHAESGSFRAFGPFVVTREAVLDDLTPRRAVAGWRVLPRFESLTVSEVAQFRARVVSLPEALEDAFLTEVDGNPMGTSGFTVTTGLPVLLADMDRSLTVTRSSVLALLIQLALLAGYALVLTAGLLIETRRSETILLRSRGTSPGQVLGSSVLEGVILTVPAVIAAPYIATALLGVLNRFGPLASIDLQIDPQPNAESFIVAAIAAVLAIVALSWPAYRSARSFPESTRHNPRQQTRTGTHRLGVDFALLALTLVIFWQLQELGPQISARVRGRFGVDPLLVLAPALGLLAGGVLALRMIPLLARLSEWLASSRTSAVAALASWQVARRPTRYARSALLLMMAIGIGFFAASYSTTWAHSQRDQAIHSVGSDIALVPDRSAGSLSDLHLSSAHRAVEGVDESMPLQRLQGQLIDSTHVGQFFLLDAAKAETVVGIRDDLGPDFGVLMANLVASRPVVASLPLPGEPKALGLEFEAIEEEPEPLDAEDTDHGFVDLHPAFNGRARLILQDGDGLLHRVDAGVIPVNVGPGTIEVELTADSATGSQVAPSYPLSLVNIEIESALPFDVSRRVELRIDGITTVDSDGVRRQIPVDRDEWELETTSVVGAWEAPRIGFEPTAASHRLAILLETGAGFAVAPAQFSIRPEGTDLPETYPVVVSETFPEANLAAVGDRVRLPPLRLTSVDAIVIGTIDAFPTVDDRLGDTILVDLPTYQMIGYEPGYGLAPVDEYWLSAPDGDPATTAALGSGPSSAFSIESADELQDRLVTDPVALGTIGALTVGFVAAAVFAAVGFAVSATVSARERLIEFALLRALGLSPRQLGSWLIVEQGVLVLVSLALGTLIGVILTAVILPLITLTRDGRAAVPDVIVVYPWGVVVGLEVAVVLTLAVIVAVLTALLRRIGLGSLLRLGED